jgi:hypothetical protein
MITIMGKHNTNDRSVEWRYIHDDDTHFVEDKYEGDYSFCATEDIARTQYNYFVKRIKVNDKWVMPSEG